MRRIEVMSAPVVLVTGALTGIGRATALAFAAEGAVVAVSGRHPDKGEALVADLKQSGALDAAFIKADVRREAEVSALVDEVVARFGRLDIAVNNAGKEALGAIQDVTESSYDEVFGTNVLGTLLSLKHEFRVMRAQGKGAIVNVGSVYGHKGFGGGGSVYAGSKFAIEGITKCAALEGAPAGIRVNAIAPGHVETAMFNRVIGGNSDVKAAISGMIPAGRVGEPKEIGDAIVFITSDKAAFMTGEIVTIDGGLAAG
jgi:NAD(P)-dependent dehydrogenase (short-subunit alcohol dehydrogenase family)